MSNTFATNILAWIVRDLKLACRRRPKFEITLAMHQKTTAVDPQEDRLTRSGYRALRSISERFLLDSGVNDDRLVYWLSILLLHPDVLDLVFSHDRKLKRFGVVKFYRKFLSALARGDFGSPMSWLRATVFDWLNSEADLQSLCVLWNNLDDNEDPEIHANVPRPFVAPVVCSTPKRPRSESTLPPMVPNKRVRFSTVLHDYSGPSSNKESRPLVRAEALGDSRYKLLDCNDSDSDPVIEYKGGLLSKLLRVGTGLPREGELTQALELEKDAVVIVTVLPLADTNGPSNDTSNSGSASFPSGAIALISFDGAATSTPQHSVQPFPLQSLHLAATRPAFSDRDSYERRADEVLALISVDDVSSGSLGQVHVPTATSSAGTIVSATTTMAKAIAGTMQSLATLLALAETHRQAVSRDDIQGVASCQATIDSIIERQPDGRGAEDVQVC